MTYLGLDIGTSAVKAVLVDEAQRPLALAEVPLETSRPRPHWSEQPPEAWWQASRTALAGLRTQQPAAFAAVRGLGLSGQMHAAVLLDADDRVLRPAILWNDGRAQAESRLLNERVPEIGRIAGVPAVNAYGATFPVALEVEGIDVKGVRTESTVPGPDDNLVWPMRVFVFKRKKLVELLKLLDGRSPIEAPLSTLIGDNMQLFKRVVAYRFGGTSGRVTQDRYWRRLDHLDDYYEANMDLLELEPPLDLYQADWQIRTYQTQRPPARTVPGRSCNEGICVNSIVSGGTVIAGGGVNHSVLGNRVYIDDGATVEDSILFSDVKEIGRASCRERVSSPV